VRNGVRRFGAHQLLLRTSDFLFAAADGSLIQFKLLLEFRNFDDREKLALRDVRAPIDVEFLDVAGDFGVDGDFLVRLEFGGDLERARNRFSADRDDGGTGGVRGIIGGHLAG